MHEHISPENLSAYLDKALSEHERRLVESHLPGCAACSRRLENFARLAGLLRNCSPFPVPPFFAERLSALIRARRQEQSLAADFTWVAKRLAPALALFLAATVVWSSWKPSISGLSLDHDLSPADSTAATSLLVQNENDLTTDDVLQLAFYEDGR